ncbi:flagellar filament capping protein FliD [Thermotalea metallivorans]|uniref:Flagellar hook-associated protein 2 n=1 Tax=Thermotalea metallivorans TaxID=520762 RepID=A0A140L728_9FIRM|nr:flagellar filament capping protein FliD [Thermotalea metallivorans]KXG76353.1 Flagellar hook-associated protein 2 [Thermotalea metallivorans]
MITSNRLRITGLATGIDTDEMVRKLMNIEYAKVDKLKQNIQIMEWQRDNYREISNLLRGFRDEYFDVIKPTMNFRSSTAFNEFKVTSADESVVTATARSGAITKTHSITVTQLATASKIDGIFPVTDKVDGSNAITNFDFSGQQLTITLDGTTKTIDMANYGDGATLESQLEAALSNAFGSGKFDILVSGDKIEFKTLLNGSTFTISGAESTLTQLGFTATDNKSNRISLDAGLDSIAQHFTSQQNFNSGDNVTLVINGVTINVGKTYGTATIKDVMNAVNSSSAGVTLNYDSLQDKFTLTSKTTGEAQTITYNSSPLLQALGIEGGTYTAGTDAVFTLDGVAGMKRSSNQFAIDGVTYTLKAVGATTVNVNADTDALVEKIKGFVSKYNDVIDKINSEFTEKRYRDYMPLTDDQKKEMSEKEIELWEKKAKSGLLRSDPILQKITTDMRKALYDSVKDVGINLYEIGITSSSLWQDRGKLVIDEEKLKKAVQDNPDKLTLLFTQRSQYSYEEGLNDAVKRRTRYEESGLAQRLYDVIQDNIRFTRDSQGKKGILLEKAGIEGDLTEFQNTMNTEINKQNKKLDTLLDKLYNKETYYYNMFSRMESAIQAMNSQAAWLMSQTGGR